MKLHLATEGDRKHFTGYGEGYLSINNQRYESSLVVSPEAVHDTWKVNGFDDLNAEHLQFLLSLKPEIVILGTGPTQRFLQPAQMRDFVTAQIGIEIMATPAACRTYNILMAEGRAVIAAVLLI